MREDPPAGLLEGAADRALEAFLELEHAIEQVLQLPDRPDSRWHRAGVSTRGERHFELASAVVLLFLVIGWTWTIAIRTGVAVTGDGDLAGAPPSVGAQIAAALSTPGAPSVAYLTDAALGAVTPLRGESGRLRARFQPGGDVLPVDSLPAGTSVELARDRDTLRVAGDSGASTRAPTTGIWHLVVRAGNAVEQVTDFNVITLVPSSARRNGRIGLYFIGAWPTEKGRRAVKPRYEPPRGFIEVTRENQDTRVSDHFRLRDFLTHDQQDVWPKYLVLEMRLLDKLELVLADLESRGIRTRGTRVMSGFRTPQYNSGGGNTSGRAELSRHMYGDASDIFIDNDGNGNMDDLNRDGRVTPADAQVILAAVDRVERAYPALIGGAGIYGRGPGHGPFIHIDTRGYRARWTDSGE